MSERVFYPDTDDVSSTSKVVALSTAPNRTCELVFYDSTRPGQDFIVRHGMNEVYLPFAGFHRAAFCKNERLTEHLFDCR